MYLHPVLWLTIASRALMTKSGIPREESLTDRRLERRLTAIGVAVAVGIAYFLGARLSLSLLTKPDGVAVFWPASGVAAGVLIALGPHYKWPVAIGAAVATIAANLLGDRTFAGAAAFALCNASEALL